MVPGWASRIRLKGRSSTPGVQTSLVWTALLLLLILSLVPFLLAGAITTLLSRSQLRAQAGTQLENISASQAAQVAETAALHAKVIERLISDEYFQATLNKLVTNPPDTPKYLEARSQLLTAYGATSNAAIVDFDPLWYLLNKEGNIILSAHDPVDGEATGSPANIDFIRGLTGSSQSIFHLETDPAFPQTLTLFTIRAVTSTDGALLATFVAAAPDPLSSLIFSSSGSHLPGAVSYVYMPGSRLIDLNPRSGSDQLLQPSAFPAKLGPMTGSQSNAVLFELETPSPTIVYAQWISEYKLGILNAVSVKDVTAKANFFSPLNLGLLGGSLLLSAPLLVFATTWLISPIHAIAKTSASFARGNWGERVSVVRKDEFGFLATTFNQMADDLSKLFTSLESSFQKRNRQLRIASEIAQLSSSSSHLGDALKRTASLLVERFNLYFVAIYLVDETGHTLVLREASGAASEQIKQRAGQAEIDQATLISWVARYNQPRVSSPDSADGLFQPDDLLPDTQAELAIPIANAGMVLGVVDIHASHAQFFDNETISIFQTLAYQVSNNLQNLRFQDSGVQSLEYALLFQVTRQVAQARSEAEITQNLKDKLSQLPLVTAMLALEEKVAKILILTDPKTGRVEKNLANPPAPSAGFVERLEKNRVILIEDISRPSEFDWILALFLSRGCQSVALISILENGQCSRILAFGAQEPALLSQASLQNYLNLADIIGAGLEKFHLLATLQQRLSALQFLNSFSQTISVETDLNRLFQILHQQAMELLGPNLEFAVALYQQSQKLIQFPYFYEEGKQISISPLPMGEGLTSILIESRKPLLLTNEQAVQARTGKVVGRGARCWMGIPLIFSGRVIGAVIIQDLERENRFDEDDVNLFNTLAPQIAIAIANAELFVGTQDLLQKHRLLRQVTIAASNSTNLEDAFHRVVSGLVSARSAEQITILLHNPQQGLQVSATAGEKGTHHLEVRITLDQGITEQAAVEMRPIRVDDMQSDPRYGSATTGMRSELAVPILFGDEILGVLNLESSQAAAFNENDEEIIAALGNNLGGIIANIRLVAQVRSQIQRERQLFEATSKIRRSVDLETILEISTQEICKAVGARRARIRIAADKSLAEPAPSRDLPGSGENNTGSDPPPRRQENQS